MVALVMILAGHFSDGNISIAMSVMGQERTLAVLEFMSAIPPITDIIGGKTDIGNSMSVSPPKADVI